MFKFTLENSTLNHSFIRFTSLQIKSMGKVMKVSEDTDRMDGREPNGNGSETYRHRMGLDSEMRQVIIMRGQNLCCPEAINEHNRTSPFCSERSAVLWVRSRLASSVDRTRRKSWIRGCAVSNTDSA